MVLVIHTTRGGVADGLLFGVPVEEKQLVGTGRQLPGRDASLREDLLREKTSFATPAAEKALGHPE
ncbi:hypothetical protein [Microvirga massiliensis]|uniref:hypothetical protein n=1 Tax=Microvirga massiliensis TaxID=1033741 RepID=UPI00062BE371|nr:hypothetical protein [Microvirga massiliensis]